MSSSPSIRRVIAADVQLVTAHRHAMFQDNAFASEEVLADMDSAFTPWLTEQLAKNKYLGFLAEVDGLVIAGAGIYVADFPPHWRHKEARRAYVLNVYTEPAFRGKGLAKLLTERALQECRALGIHTVVLHASPQGRPIYEGLGFEESDEMILDLQKTTSTIR